MSFLDRFRKKIEDEASRIERLSKTGRMADGRIVQEIRQPTVEAILDELKRLGA